MLIKKIIRIIIISSQICFWILIGTLFINGVDSIVIHLEFAYRVTGFWAFFTESSSGWATEHHITNFVFMNLFGSSPLYLFRLLKSFIWGDPKKLNKPSIKNRRRLILLFGIVIFLCCIGLTVFYAVIGEIIELGGRKIFKLISGNDTKLYSSFYGYTSETIDDVVLSDLVQSPLAGIEQLLFFIFIFNTISGLIFFKNWKRGLFRILSYLFLFTTSGFISTIRKSFGPYVFNIGFYAQMFWKISILYIYFLEDVCHVTKNKVSHVNLTSVIINYIFLTVYLILQWSGTLDLRSWGLPVSNIITIVYFFVLFVMKKASS